MSADYAAFLESKAPRALAVGHRPGSVHKMLYPFQRALVTEACAKGRFAIFADCGLGKTLMQLEWARQMRPANERVLIVAPLGVAQQTIDEAARLKLRLRYVTAPSDDDYQITNYERLHAFVGAPYAALVLDESSILKSVDGKTRTMILREFTDIRYRLACTATPAPNDVSELANHAEFCGVMSRPEMLASFFVHDSGKRLSSGPCSGPSRVDRRAPEAHTPGSGGLMPLPPIPPEDPPAQPERGAPPVLPPSLAAEVFQSRVLAHD